MIRRAGRLLAAVARFWYGFIVGDDWTVAAAVAVGLTVTWALAHGGVTAWWLMPVVVVALVFAGVTPRRRRAG